MDKGVEIASQGFVVENWRSQAKFEIEIAWQD